MEDAAMGLIHGNLGNQSWFACNYECPFNVPRPELSTNQHWHPEAAVVNREITVATSMADPHLRDLPFWSFIVGERFAGNVRWPPNLVGACFADLDGFWVNRRNQWLHVETSLSIRALLRWRPDARILFAFRVGLHFNRRWIQWGVSRIRWFTVTYTYAIGQWSASKRVHRQLTSR